MGYIPTNPAAFLLSGQGTGVPVTGSGIDCRAAKNYAYLMYHSNAPSAIIGIDVSHDGTGWMRFMTVTALPATGTAQISAYLPYVRAMYVTGYSTTGSANVFYAPGL